MCFVIGVWRATKTNPRRAAALAVGLACVGLVPLNQYSNSSRLFDPAVYFMARGGPLTGNAAALAMTSAVVLLGVLAVFRRGGRRTSRWAAVVTTLAVAGLGPFLLRDLSRGVHTPLRGVDASLWLVWEVPLFLAAVSVLLSGAAAGAIVLGPRRGAPPWLAPLIAVAAAVLAPVVWEAPGRWPWWYSILWIVAIGLLALSRRSRRVILSASTVAALGATTLVWGRTARGRVESAEHDLASLGQPDSVAATLLQRFGLSLAGEAPPTRESAPRELRHVGHRRGWKSHHPLGVAHDTGAVAMFATADIPNPAGEVARVVATARRTGNVIIEPVATDTAVELVMGAPSAGGGATGVVLAPPSRLFQSNPFAQLLGLVEEHDVEPPYSVRLRPPLLPRADTTVGPTSWRRQGTQLHGDRIVATGRGATPAHVDVELRSLDALGGAGRAHRAARSGDRRRTLAGGGDRRRRGGAVASRASPHARPQLSRAALARPLCVFRHSRARIRDLDVRTARGGRDPVARGARGRDAAVRRAERRGAGPSRERKRAFGNAAVPVPRRRAAADQRPALRRPGADGSASAAENRVDARRPRRGNRHRGRVGRRRSRRCSDTGR